MLQVANDGIGKLSVEFAERDLYLNIIKRRFAIGVTGAKWTQDTLRYLKNE